MEVLSQISCQTHTRMCLIGDGTTLQSCFGYKLFANMSRVIAEYVAKQTYGNVCARHHSNHVHNHSKCVATMLQMWCNCVANVLQIIIMLIVCSRYASKCLMMKALILIMLHAVHLDQRIIRFKNARIPMVKWHHGQHQHPCTEP